MIDQAAVTRVTVITKLLYKIAAHSCAVTLHISQTLPKRIYQAIVVFPDRTITRETAPFSVSSTIDKQLCSGTVRK